MGIDFATGGLAIARPQVYQIKYATWNMIQFNGTGYHDIATCSITPRDSGNEFVIFGTCACCFRGNHAAQVRVLRRINSGGWTTVNYASDGNRSPGHGGTEANDSDGGAFIAYSISDDPNTTGALDYMLQIKFESGDSNQRVGTSSRGYANNSSGGYPGIYRQMVTVMEVDPS